MQSSNRVQKSDTVIDHICEPTYLDTYIPNLEVSLKKKRTSVPLQYSLTST